MSHFYTNIRKWGNNLLYMGYKNGQRVKEKIAFNPQFFVPNTDAKSKYKTLDGTALTIKNFDEMKQATAYLNQYENVSNVEIYGIKDFPTQFISRLFPKQVDYNLNLLRIFHLDIEVMSDQGFIEPKDATAKVTAITIKDVKNDIFYTWGVGNYKPHLPNVVYKQFSLDTEKQMLADFISFWQMNSPDIVTGWRCNTYDIPYLFNRLKLILGDSAADKLSPWGIVFEKTTNTQKIKRNVNEREYDLYGISILDYYDLYRKYNGNEEASYKLDHIAFINLGEKKVEYDGTLHNLFVSDFQKYIEYNIQDVALVEKLENKLKFIELILEVSYMGKVPSYTDSLGTTRYWEIMIYHYLHGKGIIPKIKTFNSEKSEQFRGAFVKEPRAGKYKWVISYDLASLYPSLIRQLSIGTETLVTEIPDELKFLVENANFEALLNDKIDTSLLKKYNYSMGVNGALYTHQKSFLSDLVGDIFDKRKKYKKKMQEYDKDYQKTHNEESKDLSQIYNIKQHAAKILINSCYGALGNQYFHYYNVKNAEAVTLTGQFVIQKTAQGINDFLNKEAGTSGYDYIIAIDTDSNYLDLGPIIDKKFKDQSDVQGITNYIDTFCKKKIDPFIENLYKDIFNQLNCFENHLVMKREAISNVAIWKAKKRYAMFVLDNEGVRYAEPKLKVCGLEIVSSSTPMICQDKLEEAVKLILSGTEQQLQQFVKQFKGEFSKLEPQEIAISKGISNIEKYEHRPKGTGIHSRAALNYNDLLRKKKLDKIYEVIKSGNKIKYIPLVVPNTIHDDVIAFVDKLPKEFDLHQYIDYNTQFNKVFIKPLEPIATIVGWSLEKRNKLRDFY